MEIKKDGDSQFTRFYSILKTIINKNNKKKKIYISALIFLLIIVFVFGTIFVVKNYPSQAVTISEKMMNKIHFFPYQETDLIKGIYYENFKIPANYYNGFYHNKNEIIIDIKNNDFQKLAYQRDISLKNGQLIQTDDDYVPAKIHFNDKVVNTKLKLKGGYETDHFFGDRWSFRIKVKDDATLFGMKSFSIQDPLTRDYLSEWLYHKVLLKENVLGLRYDFINVIINGKNMGVYALEEDFDKRLIEHNNYREGPIFRIYNNGHIDADQFNSTAENSIKYQQFLKSKQLINGFLVMN